MSSCLDPIKSHGADTEYPPSCCVHQLVQAQAERTPAAIAVIDGNRRFTYRDLDARSNQLANYLTKHGVGPEVPVAICLKRSMELVVSMLAVLKAGGACVPLDPAYPPERLHYMLRDTKAALLLTQDDLLSSEAKKLSKTVDLPKTWNAIERESSERCVSGAEPKNLAYVIYTSGSTGKPRGVMLTHEGLVNHHLAAQKLYDLQSSDRVLQFSSISFDIALEEIFPTWIAGATLVLRTDETPLGGRDFVRWVQKQNISVLDLPTAYWHELVHELSELKQPMPRSIRLVIVGGEKASARAFAEWSKLVGGTIRWVNTYGPSEASIIATAYEPSSDTVWDAAANIPIGRPIQNTQVYLLDRDLKPVTQGESGELHIGGAGVARGYLNDPKRTAEKFIADPFSSSAIARLYKTGDVGRHLPSGDIEFLGRIDDQVKIRGFRVELGEVESVLSEHLGVRECVVVVKGDDAAKRLVAYVVSSQKPAPSESEFRRFLKHRLPEYMVPATVATLDRLPLTPNGKVDKKALPEPVDVQDGLRTGKAPKDAVEARIVSIWESALGKHPIGVDENFFDLGGHSLLAVRVMRALEQSFGKSLPITTLLHAPTVEKLAVVLLKQSSSASSSLVPLRMNGTKPAFFCVHGIGGTVLRFRELSRLLGSDQPFYGLEAMGLDGMQPVHTSVEEMAAHYVNEVRTANPDGPYYLGGYSFGGLIALEMAQRIRAEGYEVPLVVLLDTFPSSLKTTGSLFRTYLTLPSDQQWKHLVRKANALPRSLRRRVAMLRLPDALKKVREACYTAARAYQAKPYDGKVALFGASEKGLSSTNQEAAWRTLIPRIEIYEVSGHHGNIVDLPQVAVLAASLKTCLEAAFNERDEAIVHPATLMETRSAEGQLEIA